MRIQRGILSAGGAVRTEAPRIQIDDTGIWTLEEEYQTDRSNLLTYMPQLETPHPEFPDLVLKQLRPQFLPGGIGAWSAVYRGLVPSGDDPLALPPPVWSISTATSLEDIRSLPGFEAMIEALVEDDPDDVVFDDNDLFVGFAGPDGFRGIQSYYAPTVAITVRRVTRTTPNGGAAVGKRDTPGGPYTTPNTGPGQNWLKVGFSAEQFGGIHQVSESWLRSGDGGWNPAIYPAA
jgi:hypothetical protein